MDQLIHEVDLMSSYALTPVGHALTQSALKNNCIPVKEERYADYTVQSPLHQEVDHASAAWVILHQGILGRPSSQYPEKLRQGSFLCLDDMSLTMQNFGFKWPSLFTVLGRALHRKHGYHVFNSIPHLCIITEEFFPLDLTRVISLIAILDVLVHDSAKLNSPVRPNSIHQMVTADKSFVYPPLCTWGKDATWKHPEWYKIDQWMRGQRQDLPQVGSE